MKVKDIINEVIKKEGSDWVLYSKQGKKLGTHKTKKDAEKQEIAIQINKKR